MFGALAMKQLQPSEIEKPRNRRLRKKLRIAEFQELGVEVDANLEHAQSAWNALADEWIEFLEVHGWNFGGGIGPEKLSGFVAKHRDSLQKSERELVREWLASKFGTKNVHVGELRDCWHGW